MKGLLGNLGKVGQRRKHSSTNGGSGAFSDRVPMPSAPMLVEVTDEDNLVAHDGEDVDWGGADEEAPGFRGWSHGSQPCRPADRHGRTSALKQRGGFQADSIPLLALEG